MPALFALPPPDPAFEFFVASHGMSQGIGQSDGIQIIPRATVRVGQVQVGAQWRNISSPTATGVSAFFVKITPRIGTVQIDAGAAYRIRTGSSERRNDAWEFTLGARRSFGKIGTRFIAEYAFDEFGKGQSLYVEAGPSIDVARATKMYANFGRRERANAPDYWSANAGLSHLVRDKMLLDGRLYWTNRSSRGPAYRARIVLSARLTL